MQRYKDEGRLEELARLGEHKEPLPDYPSFHNTAENMHCPPWEMFDADDPQPPKWWWRETRMLLDDARYRAQEAKQAMNASKNGPL